jgi:outer membrane lipoprotein SlyB
MTPAAPPASHLFFTPSTSSSSHQASSSFSTITTEPVLIESVESGAVVGADVGADVGAVVGADVGPGKIGPPPVPAAGAASAGGFEGV